MSDDQKKRPLRRPRATPEQMAERRRIEYVTDLMRRQSHADMMRRTRPACKRVPKRLESRVSDPDQKPRAMRRPRATPAQMAERKRIHASRVEYVTDLMRRLRWRTGTSSEEASRLWDLPISYVNQIVAEAAATIRKEYFETGDNVTAQVAVALEEVLHRALDSGDYRTVVRAIEVWSHVTGIARPQKVEISGELSSMTPEQLAARKQELLARLLGKDIGVREIPAGEDEDPDKDPEKG